MYLLTPTGIEEKSSITLRFLKSKMRDYELLQAEISQLMQEEKSIRNPSAKFDLNSTEV